MKVVINGEERELPAGASVRDAVLAFGLPASMTGIAVARGDEVVRRGDWDATSLEDGDRVEIVTAAQGG